MEPNAKLSKTSCSPLSDPSSYRYLVGRLLYLTISGPDISYAVQVLSQFMDQPHSTHLDVVHRVLGILKVLPIKVYFSQLILHFSSKLFVILIGRLCGYTPIS
jgi:hypothetical protein